MGDEVAYESLSKTEQGKARSKAAFKINQWKPGQSGNPLGRTPVGVFTRDTAESVGKETKAYKIAGKTERMTRSRRIVQVVYEKAERGDNHCLKLLLDRLWPSVHHSKSLNIAAGPKDILEALDKLKSDVAVLPGTPSPTPPIEVPVDQSSL